jgi:hypothetical protein
MAGRRRDSHAFEAVAAPALDRRRAVAILIAGAATACNVFPFGANQALKWGASNPLGTPGGIVT